MSQLSPAVPLREVLKMDADWITIQPHVDYRQVTARLWGKGLTLRGVVRGTDIAAPTQNRVKAGQFLISKIDARHGAFGLVPPDLDGAVVSADFPSFSINTDVALPTYVEWASRTDWFVSLCKVASEGSTNRVRLKEERFLSQAIPLPSIQIQKLVVARLDHAAKSLEKRRSMMRTAESELVQLLYGAFKRLTLEAPHLKMRDVAPLVRRPVPIQTNAVYTEIGIRSFFRGTFHRRTLSGAEFTWQKLFRVAKGDLVFSNLMAWEQGIAVACPTDDGCVGNHRMLTCEADPSRILSGFLWFYFTTPPGFAQVLAASPGSIARNKTLSAEDLPNITVPVPSLDAQAWFVALHGKVEAVRKIQAEVTSELAQLTPALLEAAFGSSGNHEQVVA